MNPIENVGAAVANNHSNGNGNGNGSDSEYEDFPDSDTASDSDTEYYTCSVCLCTAQDAVVTYCSHIFCRRCIGEWIKRQGKKSRCPNCNSFIGYNTLISINTTDQPGRRIGPAGDSIRLRPVLETRTEPLLAQIVMFIIIFLTLNSILLYANLY